MFFTLSKLLDIAIDPFWWMFGFTLAGVVLLLRNSPRRRGALGLISLGLGLGFVCALPSVSNRVWRSLEGDVVSTMRADVTYDAVVLLGGTVSPLGSVRDEPAWNDNIERLLSTHALLQSGRAKVVIVSGGELGAGLLTEAEYLARELERLGVAKDRILVEAKARNTRENATLSKPMLESLGAKRVLLVTSAFHMPRAQGCFRAVDIEADVLPVDFRMREPSADPALAPRADYLAGTARALREWLGRTVYRVMGYAR